MTFTENYMLLDCFLQRLIDNNNSENGPTVTTVGVGLRCQLIDDVPMDALDRCSRFS